VSSFLRRHDVSVAVNACLETRVLCPTLVHKRFPYCASRSLSARSRIHLVEDMANMAANGHRAYRKNSCDFLVRLACRNERQDGPLARGQAVGMQDLGLLARPPVLPLMCSRDQWQAIDASQRANAATQRSFDLMSKYGEEMGRRAPPAREIIEHLT
jgi:hypothetical protein